MKHEVRATWHIKLLIYIFILSLLTITGLWSQEEPKKTEPTLNGVLGEIEKLENKRDPKCHATATRLENFMYGTKLVAEARFLKVTLQKKLVGYLWEQVSHKHKETATNQKTSTPLVEDFKNEMANLLQYSRNPEGDIVVDISSPNSPNATASKATKTEIILSKRDFEHYSSVAYGLRTILALQQEVLYSKNVYRVPLDAASIEALKEFQDVFTLAVLQVADRQARLDNEYVISAATLQRAWDQVQHLPDSVLTESANPLLSERASTMAPSADTVKFVTLSHIIDQKVKSFEVYNNISMPVFLRNLQVYFARHKWPTDPVEGKGFRDLFTEAMVAFTLDGWKQAETIAKKKGQSLVREADVEEMWRNFVPFEVNEYEDVLFFANLGNNGSLTIESYDCDAFRDSGIHWRYLQYTLQDHMAELSIEPDPFAAELLVEGVAQYGVLVLRVAGLLAKEKGETHLKIAHLTAALKEIHRRAELCVHTKQTATLQPQLVSSSSIAAQEKGNTYFTDVTSASGIGFMHRSSDWLSRLLRSYLEKGADVATLSIPPAFGGSGVAADDVNGDGFTDVLLLSGTGNALFLGDGKGGFKDGTMDAKLVFKREDGTGGEPRQPLIADFDNDGDQDIFISYVNDNHRLYRNLGNGTFEDVSATSNLGGQNLVAGPALTFDYDGDGLLDIYIGYFGDYLHGILPTLNRSNLNALPNKLFRNKGNMVFEDVTARSGTGNTGWTQAAAHTDFDLDGWQDIIVGNDFGVNVYYRNRGDGTFEDIATALGTDKPSFTMNVGITDLNRDGFPDIYISNIVTMVKDEKYVLPGADTAMKFNPAKLGRMRVIEANDLFISNAGTGKLLGFIHSDAVGRGFNSTGWSWGANFFDFDNDGDDDLYCVNGMNEYSVYSDTPYYSNVFDEKREISLMVYQKESNVFFVNQGAKLLNFSKESGADLLGNSRSTVYLDYDNDGDLDIVLNNYHGSAVVYRNNSQTLNNHQLTISLEGDPAKQCNRDAIGARIIASKNGQQLVWREIRGGDGYLSMNPKTQSLGLGKENTVDISVYWPNGITSHFKEVEAGKSYRIRLANGQIEESK